ncbi:MAG: 6-bladed beta-propeller [Caldisericia bacterium]
MKEIGKEAEVSLVYPTGVCVGQMGDIYVVDKMDNNIKVFDSSGKHLKTIGGMGTTGGFFREPTDICIDTISNRLYISDTKNPQDSGSFNRWRVY